MQPFQYPDPIELAGRAVGFALVVFASIGFPLMVALYAGLAARVLLAALEYAHNHIMNPDNTDLPDLYRTIRAAIAAAKGGA